LNLCGEKLVSKRAFEFNLYHYIKPARQGPMVIEVGLCRLNQVDP
jgi:hypothetical protein